MQYYSAELFLKIYGQCFTLLIALSLYPVWVLNIATVLRQKSGSLGRCARVYATATTNPLPSTHHPTTTRRSFGQEISGNCRPKAELMPAARAALLAKHEAGVSRAELAHEFDVYPSCVYKTIKRWSNYKTLKSLPRSSRPKNLT